MSGRRQRVDPATVVCPLCHFRFSAESLQGPKLSTGAKMAIIIGLVIAVGWIVERDAMTEAIRDASRRLAASVTHVPLKGELQFRHQLSVLT